MAVKLGENFKVRRVLQISMQEMCGDFNSVSASL